MAGLEAGISQGVIRAMTPDEKNRGAFRRNQIESVLREYADNAAALIAGRKYARYWPDVMPGGWPIPAEYFSVSAETLWPEVDGWPCPPPALRGGA